VGDGIVINPATGEVLSLDEPTEILARWLSETRELEERLREEKRRVTRELIDRMDRDASYTLRAGDLEIKGDGPEAPTEYDAEALYAELKEFVDSEAITEDALARAVEPVVTYKPRAGGLNALRKRGGSIADAIERHSRPKENYERRVSIKARDVA
jgi:hypothetical protein